MGQEMPFFVKGLDLHAKCSTTVAITESSFEKSHAHHAQSCLSPWNTKECAETKSSCLCKHWWTYPTCDRGTPMLCAYCIALLDMTTSSCSYITEILHIIHTITEKMSA